MIYLLLALILGAVVYFGWRAAQVQARKPKTRVIGPDDDPEFLSRLGRDNPR